jgi:hypothetical protein
MDAAAAAAGGRLRQLAAAPAGDGDGDGDGAPVAVNLGLYLHRVADEGVSTSNPRDALLRAVRAELRPRLVTLVERSVNANTAPFYARFAGALAYYGAMFEALDEKRVRRRTTKGKGKGQEEGGEGGEEEEEEAMGMARVEAERHCLGREMVDVVAREGAARSARYEPAGKWRARLAMAGFRNVPPSPYVSASLRDVLHLYSPSYRLVCGGGGDGDDPGFLHLHWASTRLVSASAWQCR